MKRPFLLTALTVIALAGALAAQLPPPPIPPQPGIRPVAPAPDPPGIVARFGAAYFRHEASVNAMTFSVDGKYLAVVASNRITLWDTLTAKEMRTLPIRNVLPFRLSFSADGKEIHGLGHDGVVRTWNVETGAEADANIPPGRFHSPRGIDWSPSAKLVLLTDNTGTLHLLNATDRTEVRQWQAHSAQALALAITADGKLAASIGREDRPLLWDVATGKEARALERLPPSQNRPPTAKFVFSNDGKFLALGSYDRTITVWDTATGKIARRLEFPLNAHGAFNLTFSPDGKFLAARLTERTIRIWGLASGLELRCLDASDNTYEPVAFSADSQTLAAAHGASVRLWDVRSARERFPSAGHAGAITGLLFLADGKMLASTAGDMTVRLWDLAAKKETARERAQTSFIQPLTPASEPGTLDVFGYNGAMTLKLAKGRLLTEDIRSFNLNGTVRGVSPQGRWLAVVPNQALALIDAKTGRHERTLSSVRGHIQLLQFSPDERLLAAWLQQAGNEPQNLRIWETASGRELPQRLPDNVRTAPMRALAFSRTGRLLAMLDYNNALHVVETATGIVRHSVSIGPENPLASIAFNADGTVLFVGLANGRLLVRDLVHGLQTGPFRAHTSSLQVFALSRDGSQLATGGADGTILLCATAALQPARPAVSAATAAAIEQWWQDLGVSDGTRTSLALWGLHNHPDAALATIRERFQPDIPLPPPPSAVQLSQWTKNLDDERFSVRTEAYRALATAGEAARPALMDALNRNPNDEVRRRATLLLRNLSVPLPPAKLRMHRILELLERIGTPAARQLLSELAKKASDPDFRMEALRLVEYLERPK